MRLKKLVGVLGLVACSTLAFGQSEPPRRWKVSPLQAATLEGLFAKSKILEDQVEAERKRLAALEADLEATRGHMETAVAAIRSELSIPKDLPLRTVPGSGWSELEEAPTPPEPPASIKRPGP